ncbi:UDP-2,3-diacylglucosamine hydrolase [Stieleria bergensis]|uniref:UDP-2,3-diacylglucosamine hydrolase n=1 Tax=Stieleria bergensis TaxID=2528025 RepID=A0A517SV91_9BACT|nr:UDP-2,3-diacylglucosamine hydrolase [Planctomycetes bacterium SV_7m_r]
MNHSVPQPVQTLLVSDLHLGCKHSRSKEFLEFLNRYSPQAIYLVGDFFDAWKVNDGWRDTPDCQAIIDHLIALSDSGTTLHYTPGNHDAFLRDPGFDRIMPADFPDVQIDDTFYYESLRGWRFLITHGDLFDSIETRAQWISKSFSAFYDHCLSLNRLVIANLLRSQRNPYGVCGFVKGRVKRAVKMLSRYEDKIMSHAAEHDCDGIIFGHLHTPAIKKGDTVLYVNTGDWVENCTGLVEHLDGRFELVRQYGQNQYLQLEDRNAENAVLPFEQVAPC